MKTLLLIILFSPIKAFCPPAIMTQQDIIKAWEFNFLMQPFSPECLKTALEIFVDKPAIAFAQVILETGNFTSAIYLENNNLFGMKLAKCRVTTAIGENRHSAVYRSWFDSLIDYKLWQEYWKEHGYNSDEMLTIYCPDKDYSSKIYYLCNAIQ